MKELRRKALLVAWGMFPFACYAVSTTQRERLVALILVAGLLVFAVQWLREAHPTVIPRLGVFVTIFVVVFLTWGILLPTSPAWLPLGIVLAVYVFRTRLRKMLLPNPFPMEIGALVFLYLIGLGVVAQFLE